MILVLPPGINVDETSENPSSAQRLGVNTGESLLWPSLLRMSVWFMSPIIEVVSVDFFPHQNAVNSLYLPLARSTYVPAGNLVHTIEDVVSVRDIGWETGSDSITVTTDNEVYICLPQKLEYQNFDLFIIRSFCTLWRRAQSHRHVGSAQEKTHFLCVAGVQWRTSVLGGLSVSTALNQGDGSRAPASVSPPLSLQPSSFWTLPPLWVKPLLPAFQQLFIIIHSWM